MDDRNVDDADAAAKAAAAAALTAKAAIETVTKVDAASDAAVESVKASVSASSAASEFQADPDKGSLSLSEDTGSTNAATKLVSSTQAASVAAANVADKVAEAKEGAAVVAADAADASVKAQAVTGSATKETPQTLIATAVTTGYYDLLKAVVLDHRLSGSEKKEVLLQLKAISPTSDRITYRTAILLLGLIAIITICAVWNLMWNGKNVSDGLIAIASGAVGGLAGLLSPSKNSDPHL